MLSWLGIITFVPPPTAVFFKLKGVQFGAEILDIVKEELAFMFWDVEATVPVGASSLLISVR